ncbi:hypothetical protein Hanom_Chr09g00790701 [Helianthus anomalus]
MRPARLIRRHLLLARERSEKDGWLRSGGEGSDVRGVRKPCNRVLRVAKVVAGGGGTTPTTIFLRCSMMTRCHCI